MSRSWMFAAGLVLVWMIPACTEEVAVEGAKCDDTHPCPEGLACAGGVCIKPGPLIAYACMKDDDCPAGVCMKEAHICVGCMRHEDCVSFLCEFRTHICLGCKADWQCPTGSCDEKSGICEKSSTDRPD